MLFQQKSIAQDLDYCSAKYPSITSYQPPPLFSGARLETIDISANKTLSEKDGSSTFEGDVIVERHELRIKADMARFDNKSREISAYGKVHIDTMFMSVDADSGRFFMDENIAEFINIQFFIPEARLRGNAEKVTSYDKDLAILSSSSITSCPPDDVDWLLSGSSIELDLVDDYGKARNVVLRFQKVPFLYTPYIEFPIGNKRRSGLLTPSFGTSSSRGFELAVPWYWNIAPNQDATIAPHFMNRRGWQVDAQYRYLTKTTDGTFDVNYLHEDRITRDQRYSMKYLQNTRFTSDIRLNIDFKDVSDNEYLQDFSSSLLGTSTTHLSQSADLTASYTNWQMHALLQSHQTLDLISAKPYKMLPKLEIQGNEELLDNMDFTLDTQWINFVHEDDISEEGPRFIFQPGIELPFQGSAWFLKPAIEFNHTQYNIADGSGTKIDTIDRNLPITSIDSGLFFERNMSNKRIQTLEPRLFYLYVPFEDQSDLPLFDTSVPELTLLQMFRKNRFIGGDRIADANQVTAALSSRIIDLDTGHEFMRATVGQIYYFDDRRVTLNAGEPATSTSSDIIGEIEGTVSNWSAKAGITWDIERRRGSKYDASLHYESGTDTILNLGYSRRRESATISEELEQGDVSLVAPVGKNFKFIGRWNYSFEQDRDLETITGFAYESCCWSMIVALQRNLVASSTIDEDIASTILFQLVLKGLGSVSGDSAADKLKKSITGYKDEF